MSCGCNKTTLQGKQYCQDCMPDEYHWLVPVAKEPDPFFMDRHHAYIMPNNTIYVLSHDRTQAIDISGNDIDLTPYALKTELANKITELNQKLATGLEGAKYYEGEGIRIDADKRIHSTVNLTEVNERLDAIEQAGNSPYKAGTGIEITPDLTINNTVSTDALESRVQALEEKEDQNTTYTAGIGLQLNGTEFSVDPNDLPGLDQVDDLRDRVTTLEGKTDADTKYTAGNGLILSGTEFSIDDSKVATQLYNVSTHTLVHDFSNEPQTFYLDVKEKNEDGKVFGHLTFKYIDQSDQTIVHYIPLSQSNGLDNYVIQYDNYTYIISNLITSQETLESLGYTITVNTNIYRITGSLVLNSVLYRETPNTDNEHIVTILELEDDYSD